LILVVGGASAAYVQNVMLASRNTDRPVVAAITPAPGPTDSRVAKSTAPAVKPEPDVKFDFRSEPVTPTSDKHMPDPFDPSRIATANNTGANRQAGVTGAGDRKDDVRTKPDRQRVASNDQPDSFLSVKPLYGKSAEEIIVQKRGEVTIAQYAAPMPTDDSNRSSEAGTNRVQPFVETASPDVKASDVPGGPHKAVAMADTENSEVLVNGKPTDVQTAIGYDKRGRPVLLKLNIGARPVKGAVRPDK